MNKGFYHSLSEIVGMSFPRTRYLFLDKIGGYTAAAIADVYNLSLGSSLVTNFKKFAVFRQEFIAGVKTWGEFLRDQNITLNIIGQESIPKDGKFILACNHPSGLLDGFIALAALEGYGQNLQLAAHHFLGLFDPEKKFLKGINKSKAIAMDMDARIAFVHEISEGLDQGKPFVIFPAGRHSNLDGGVFEDPEWKTTALRVAHQSQKPIVLGNINIQPSDYEVQMPGLVSTLKEPESIFEILFTENKNVSFVVHKPIYPDEIFDGIVENYQPGMHITNEQLKLGSEKLRKLLYTEGG